MTKKNREHEGLSFWETLSSVLWAMIGVQKQKNAQRDFSKGKASHFIIIGIMFALFFVVVLATLVIFITEHAK